MCAGCEATDGNEPLLCACGKHSAKHDAGKGKKARPKWLIYSSARPSEKPKLATSRSKKAGALLAVIELCKGTLVKSAAKSARAAAPAVTGLPAKPAMQLRERQDHDYDDTTRQATRSAGPGRGNKGKLGVEDAVDQAERVLKKPKASEEEMRRALGRITGEHKLLRRWCDKVSTCPYLVSVESAAELDRDSLRIQLSRICRICRISCRIR